MYSTGSARRLERRARYPHNSLTRFQALIRVILLYLGASCRNRTEVYERVRRVEDGGFRPGGRFVLYWLRVNRRAASNHALTFAAELANRLELPLLVYERLSCYPEANDRHHTFLLEGVEELAADLKALGAGYCFHLERRRAEGLAVLRRLASEASAFVTDDYPETVAARYGFALPGPLGIDQYVVDSSCVVPMKTIEKKAYAAFSFRPRIRAATPQLLKPVKPVKVQLPFPEWTLNDHTPVSSAKIAELVASCQIDHSVRPSTSYHGGRAAALARLHRFLEERLRRYAAERHQPSAHATSGLSPYLHFGHISALEVALEAQQYASKHRLIAAEFL